ETERKAAADTVYEMLTLMEHFYGSGGDRRFAERMPASATVVDEMIEVKTAYTVSPNPDELKMRLKGITVGG
ncbi:hypothetical protein LCGC14_2640660, partial [marine sediment metagenome]